MAAIQEEMRVVKEEELAGIEEEANVIKERQMRTIWALVDSQLRAVAEEIERVKVQKIQEIADWMEASKKQQKRAVKKETQAVKEHLQATEMRVWQVTEKVRMLNEEARNDTGAPRENSQKFEDVISTIGEEVPKMKEETQTQQGEFCSQSSKTESENEVRFRPLDPARIRRADALILSHQKLLPPLKVAAPLNAWLSKVSAAENVKNPPTQPVFPRREQRKTWTRENPT